MNVPAESPCLDADVCLMDKLCPFVADCRKVEDDNDD